MVDLGGRLEAAMRSRNVTVSALAKAVGVTYQGIKKVVDGKTKEMDSANLLKIAAYLQVNPEWLRTGQGVRDLAAPPRSERTVSESEWAMLEDFNMLPDDEKAALRNTLKAKAEHVRKIVNEYLGKRGISPTPATNSRIEETYGAPPPPAPAMGKTGAGSWEKITPVPSAPGPKDKVKGR